MKKKFSIFHFPFSINEGFTLIELVLVVAIMGIISVGGIAAFLNYSRNQVVKTAISDVANILSVAKLRSLSQTSINPNTNLAWCGSSSLVGYKVLLCRTTNGSGNVTSNPECINTDNGDYELQVICSDSTKFLVSGYSKKLPEKTIFPTTPTSPIPSQTLSFLFRILSGGVETSDGSNPGTINITGFGQSKTISVYKDSRIIQN